MGFLWRRRSSLLKIACLLSAVWFTVAFLIYSDDRRNAGTAGSGLASNAGDVPSLLDSHNLPLRAQQPQDPAAFDFNNNNDIGDGVAEAAPVNGGVGGGGGGGGSAAVPVPMVRDRNDAVGEPVGGGDGAVDAAVASFGNVIAGKLRADELKVEAAAGLDDGK